MRIKTLYLEAFEQEPALAICHERLITERFVEEGELEVTTYLRPTAVAMAKGQGSRLTTSSGRSQESMDHNNNGQLPAKKPIIINSLRSDILFKLNYLVRFMLASRPRVLPTLVGTDHLPAILITSFQ